MHKIICIYFFFWKKNVCLPYLKFSDPLPETHVFCCLALKEDQKLGFKTDNRLMQVKSIAECSILWTFIKQSSVFKTFILSIFERAHKTGVTVLRNKALVKMLLDHLPQFKF